MPLIDALSTPAALAERTAVYQVPTASVGVQSGPLVTAPALRISICAPVPGSMARQA